MKPDIVIIGHIIHETIQFPDRIISPVLGSPVAYSSVVASVLGVKVGIVTKIGQDMPPELLAPFDEAGVNTAGVKMEGPTSTRNLLIYDASGDKEVRYLYKAPNIWFDDIPAEYHEARLIFVCPMDYEVPLETVKAVRNLGATIMVDLGGYGGATSVNHPTPAEQRDCVALKELIQCVDVVKASLEDCRHLLGEGPSAEEIAAWFVDWGAQVGMVTLGSEGAMVATRDARRRIPSFQARVVDATGAGDAYSAGFLVEYLWTRDVWKAAAFGCATASLVIEGSGGVQVQRMPSADQVQARIQGGSL